MSGSGSQIEDQLLDEANHPPITNLIAMDELGARQQGFNDAATAIDGGVRQERKMRHG